MVVDRDRVTMDSAASDRVRRLTSSARDADAYAFRPGGGLGRGQRAEAEAKSRRQPSLVIADASSASDTRTGSLAGVTDVAGSGVGGGGGSLSLWQQFSEHVKGISINTISFESKQVQSLPSEAFRSVRAQLASESESQRRRGVKRAAILGGERGSDTSVASGGDDVGALTSRTASDVGGDDATPPPPQQQQPAPPSPLVAHTSHVELLLPPTDKRVLDAAQRGWRVVKKCVDDQRSHNARTKTAYGGDGTISWRMLKRTVEKLTEAEKSRRELYDKYLYNRNRNAWADGLVNYPKFLLERAAKASRRHSPDARARPPGSAPVRPPTHEKLTFSRKRLVVSATPTMIRTRSPQRWRL